MEEKPDCVWITIGIIIIVGLFIIGLTSIPIIL